MPNTTASPIPRPDVVGIEARAKTLGVGGWQVEGDGPEYEVRHVDDVLVADVYTGYFAAEFIAHARQDIPALIAHIGRLDAVVEAARGFSDDQTESRWIALDDALAALKEAEDV